MAHRSNVRPVIVDHLPGGAKKFTIRFDPRTNAYWSLTNPVMGHTERNAGSVRNTLALLRSDDLIHWQIRCILLHHPDVVHHGFQYPDWVFEGDDLIAAIRTAHDDGLGGARNAHDANYLTFHRFENFRDLTIADSVVDPDTIGLAAPVGGLRLPGQPPRLVVLALPSRDRAVRRAFSVPYSRSTTQGRQRR